MNQFPLGAGLVRKGGELWVMQDGCFSPLSSPPGRRGERIFLNIYCGNLVELLEINLNIGAVGRGHGWILLGFLTLGPVHAELPAVLQVQSWLASPGLVSACLSLPPGGQWFTPVPLSLTERRVVAFSACPAFYMLLERNGDFQVAYMCTWKPSPSLKVLSVPNWGNHNLMEIFAMYTNLL